MSETKDTLLKYFNRLTSLFPHDAHQIKIYVDMIIKSCHEETETRKRGPTARLPVYFLSGVFFFKPCVCSCALSVGAHMQVSSILGVCAVVCVCVTAGVSKEGLML